MTYSIAKNEKDNMMEEKTKGQMGSKGGNKDEVLGKVSSSTKGRKFPLNIVCAIRPRRSSSLLILDIFGTNPLSKAVWIPRQTRQSRTSQKLSTTSTRTYLMNLMFCWSTFVYSKERRKARQL